MAIRDFSDLQREVFRLYNQGAYREALALIDREAGRFPDYAPTFYFWRACLACRADGADAGLRWLQ
ncbi:MAG: alpha/beta hydrolase, partial [Bacillota bacterium]